MQTREILASVDELLAPANLGKIESRLIDHVYVKPLKPMHFSASGNSFLTVSTSKGGGQYVVKLAGPDSDWMINATHDWSNREVTLWRMGVLDHLPAEITHPIVSCSRNERGWALLMHDVSDRLFDKHREQDKGACKCVIDSMAAMHARFWEDSALQSPDLGLCTTQDYLGLHDPELMRQFVHLQPLIETIAIPLWNVLDQVLDSKTNRAIRRLASDPTSLSRSLDSLPRTLVHGDVRPANVGLEGNTGDGIILLDWQLAMYTSPYVDLGRYILGGIPISEVEALEVYQDGLRRRLPNPPGKATTLESIELSFLGSFVSWGRSVLKRWKTDPEANQASFEWWMNIVHAGLRRTGIL